MLQQAISDSLANAVNIMWLSIRRPESAGTGMALQQNIYNEVHRTLDKMENNRSIRRRTTDLGGI